ncbi:hypothetical protein [Desulfonauticus submarinus]|uniref:Uncharacterized protein n=1 Tax=Desulfonauticus submarinus TaxID=206665 RepID=A0A1H0CNR0_9BACT|nr:hypothetical protein [Desulfonauticus submarinus]SDN59475.1 hypothetical protein SAMN04488516_103120 [Desulfonauticus submarinus]
MLIIRCSGCKKKLWKYYKIGKGEVLRCHKDRIKKIYYINQIKNKIYCECGQVIAIDKGKYYKMISKGFIYTGTKD